MRLSRVAHNVLKRLHVIASMQQIRILIINFLNAARDYLMVETLNLKTNLLQVINNVISYRNGLVIRRNREVAIIDTNLVPRFGE